ncbi:unnamed protein product [Heligmosomoides polygyrus]|uniref:START domain-containing protein n=1 Tax=Heligmosomoides polygyrus TaxID=6339 RepID=A0A183FS05_HELPZ|nr:unnamed protein product [Heligmosomoides polygyrus]
MVFISGLADMTSVTLHGVTDTLSPQDEKYASALETAAAVFKDVETLFNDPAFIKKIGWRVDEENDEGDVVYAKNTPKGKMVAVATELPLDVDSVMNETWTGVEGLPKWNPNINFARTIASPTPHFDIVTYGNNDVLIVSGRDFVSARLYRKTSTGYILASRSVRVKECPEQKGKVRAELIMAGAQFRPHPEKKDTTIADVVMMADLKGMLPRFLVNQVVGRIMLMDTEENRRHFQDIRDQRLLNGVA